MEGIKINSNINLYYIPMTKMKTTTVGVYIHRQLCSAEVSKNAVLPYVMRRGCELCPDSEAMAQYLENLYGARMSANTMKLGDDHIIHFGFEAISDKYAPNGENLTSGIARLMMSVVFEPTAFTVETVELEKKNACERIMAEMNDKAVYAMRRCSEEMCKGDSFALSMLGTVDGVNATDASVLKEHYEKIITSSVIDIYVCGDTDINVMSGEIKKYTDRIAFRDATIPQAEMFEGNSCIKNITDKLDVTQGKLCMGFRTGIKGNENDYISLMVLSSIYGGGAHSKLFNNVREKLSLCYYASSSLVKNKGIMFVNAGIEFKNFKRAYDEILSQLEAIKNGAVSELEFNSSVKSIENDLESYKDNQRMMQVYYLGQKITGTDYDIDTLKERISKITLDDVTRAAKKIELDTVYFLTGKEEA